MRSVAPRPDPNTGEPRPPEAFGGEPVPAKRPRKPLWPLKPPPGRGAVLEYFLEPITTTIVVTLCGAVFFALLWALGVRGPVVDHTPDSELLHWRTWIVFLLVGYGLARAITTSKCVAGADWLRVGRKYWVETYELKSVAVPLKSPNDVVLRDRCGRAVRAEFSALQANSKLWDLVYNGILYSCIEGNCKINDSARGKLNLRIPEDIPYGSHLNG